MSTIVTRSVKGYPLTWDEADANFTNLNIDKVENTTLSAEDGSQLVGFIQTGTGAVPTNTQTKLREVFSVADFGVIGDGSNETTTLQNALNAAEGSILLMDGELVYGYTSLTIKQNTTVIANGSVFNRVTASTSPGIVIESGVNIDSLVITTPGGSSGDKGVAIQGSNVIIDRLSVTATTQGVYNSTNYAVEIESSPSGTQLSNITIDSFYCKYFSAGIFAKNVSAMNVGSGLVEYYRTAVYLRDVSNSGFSNVHCRYLGNAVNGRPGENGLLIESSLASDSTNNLVFNKWFVEDAGEHSYRLGGQLSIDGVWFNDCVSKHSGSSILSGNVTSGEWHGGCGFKVLGGNTTITEFHRNIHFTNCGVVDCDITYGTYPSGHGVNNFQPWLIVMAKNVYLNNCWTTKEDNAYVARYGILMTASDGVYLNSCAFRDIYLVPLHPYEETPISGFPGSDLPLVNLHITGGLFEATAPNAGDGVCFYVSEAADYNHKNWNVSGATFKGGALAVRFETVDLGSYENINLDFTYYDSNINELTYGTPVVAGGNYATINAKAPYRPLAYTLPALNGSIFQDTLGGQIYEKSDGVWRQGRKTYSVIIADDGFTTITPPSDLDPGFILISGSGTTKHMMAWYRATSTPASSKYAGAAATVIVNTPLTGTTGTDGNITVGVQNDLIYIENRGGSSDTFLITFL